MTPFLSSPRKKGIWDLVLRISFFFLKHRVSQDGVTFFGKDARFGRRICVPSTYFIAFRQGRLF